MSSCGEETFDDFLNTTDLRSWDRNYMKWYGSVGEDLGAPKTFFFPTLLRAGFEPLRRRAIPQDSSRPKSYCS